MKSEESILLRAASNMAGRASRLQNSRAQQAMFWMAQLFLMTEHDSNLNYLLRASAPSHPKPSIVNQIRMRSGNDHLIKEMRHGV